MHALQMLHLWPKLLGTAAFLGFDLIGALLWGILATIYLWLAQMLWNVNSQAWMYLVLLADLNLILACVSILGASSFQALLPAVSVNRIVQIYCLLPGTKASYGIA